MSTTTVTSKGQITLPKAIRDLLGVKEGDRVSFRALDDGRVVVEAETLDLRTLRGSVRSRVKGVTVEAMHEAIRRGGAGR